MYCPANQADSGPRRGDVGESMPWRPNGRRFRGLSLLILRPVQETSAIVHETSDIDTGRNFRVAIEHWERARQDSLSAAVWIKACRGVGREPAGDRLEQRALLGVFRGINAGAQGAYPYESARMQLHGKRPLDRSDSIGQMNRWSVGVLWESGRAQCCFVVTTATDAPRRGLRKYQ